MADEMAEDLGEGMTDAGEDDVSQDDLPFNELPIEVQLKKMPKRPKSRRSWLSKALIVTLFLTPFGVTAVGLIPVLDPETAGACFILAARRPALPFRAPNANCKKKSRVAFRIFRTETAQPKQPMKATMPKGCQVMAPRAISTPSRT